MLEPEAAQAGHLSWVRGRAVKCWHWGLTECIPWGRHRPEKIPAVWVLPQHRLTNAGTGGKSCQARLQKHLVSAYSRAGNWPVRETVGISVMGCNSNW